MAVAQRWDAQESREQLIHSSSSFCDEGKEDRSEDESEDYEYLSRDVNFRYHFDHEASDDANLLPESDQHYVSSFTHRHQASLRMPWTGYRLATCILDIFSTLENKLWVQDTGKGVTYSKTHPKTYPKRYSWLAVIAGVAAILILVLMIIGSIGDSMVRTRNDRTFGRVFSSTYDPLFNGTSSALYFAPPPRGAILNDDGLVKPKGVEIHGLVFYGRWSRVSILDCYLKRNLKENGGWLDKVIFVVRTTVEQDLEALDWLLNSTNSYVMGETALSNDNMDFSKAWAGIKRDILYVKIDDDIVYIDSNTIPRLVHHKLTHPEHLLVSANSINNPSLSWVHFHLGAILPFLPDETPLPAGYSSRPGFDWRPSKLPFHTFSAIPPYRGSTSLKNNGAIPKPPLRGYYRLLPLDDSRSPSIIDLTPIASAAYAPFGAGWSNPLIAVQQHYSFLTHIENKTTDVYNMGLWDTHYDRLSMNMVAVWGRDILDNMPIPRDDEEYLTQEVAKMLGKHIVVVGSALAAHFSFTPQVNGVERSDVLDRYRRLADEVCGKWKGKRLKGTGN